MMRIDFESFKNMTAPAAATLKKPTTGWEEQFKVVYMGASDGGTGTTAGFAAAPTGPINVIVVDTTTSRAQLSAQLVAADQVVNAAGNNVRIAVLAHPYGSAPVVPLTSLSQSNARATIKAAIAKIALSTAGDDTTAGDRLFNWAESMLPASFPSGATSTSAQGYYYRLYSTKKGWP